MDFLWDAITGWLKDILVSGIAIQNLLNAIQQGILTKPTKNRLEELEAAKEELETKNAGSASLQAVFGCGYSFEHTYFNI